MKIFVTKTCAREARRLKIGSPELCGAGESVERGAVDADLGGGMIKQRIARPNAGRSGGFRAIILNLHDNRLLFVDIYAKSRLDNISKRDMAAYRALSKFIRNLSEEKFSDMLKNGSIVEVRCD